MLSRGYNRFRPVLLVRIQVGRNGTLSFRFEHHVPCTVRTVVAAEFPFIHFRRGWFVRHFVVEENAPL